MNNLYQICIKSNMHFICINIDELIVDNGLAVSKGAEDIAD